MLTLYSLHPGLAAWELVFDGRTAVLRHEQGLSYVAYLLRHPSAQPMHALELALIVAAGPSVRDPSRPGGGARSIGLVEQRSAGWDDAETAQRLYKKRLALEAVLEDECESEPVKAEARAELETLADFQSRALRRTRDTATRTVDAVRKAINRLYRRLESAQDALGRPHPVLRPFARHLLHHLLIPSGRGRNRWHRGGGGCFVYEPPEGIRWEE